MSNNFLYFMEYGSLHYYFSKDQVIFQSYDVAENSKMLDHVGTWKVCDFFFHTNQINKEKGR